MPLRQGLVPGDWKTANVTPIFKKGDRNILRNYRPINLTSVVGKMLESIIRDKTVRYLESYSLIRDTISPGLKTLCILIFKRHFIKFHVVS